MSLDAGVSLKQQTNIQVNKQIIEQTKQSKNAKVSNFITSSRINKFVCDWFVVNIRIYTLPFSI
jgi:hypothetical protein